MDFCALTESENQAQLMINMRRDAYILCVFMYGKHMLHLHQGRDDKKRGYDKKKSIIFNSSRLPWCNRIICPRLCLPSQIKELCAGDGQHIVYGVSEHHTDTQTSPTHTNTWQQEGNPPFHPCQTQRVRKVGHWTRCHFGCLWQNMPVRSRCVFFPLRQVFVFDTNLPCDLCPFSANIGAALLVLFCFFSAALRRMCTVYIGYSRHILCQGPLRVPGDVQTFHLPSGSS